MVRLQTDAEQYYNNETTETVKADINLVGFITKRIKALQALHDAPPLRLHQTL